MEFMFLLLITHYIRKYNLKNFNIGSAHNLKEIGLKKNKELSLFFYPHYLKQKIIKKVSELLDLIYYQD